MKACFDVAVDGWDGKIYIDPLLWRGDFGIIYICYMYKGS